MLAFFFPHGRNVSRKMLKNVTEIIYQKWDFECIFTFFFFYVLSIFEVSAMSLFILLLQLKLF